LQVAGNGLSYSGFLGDNGIGSFARLNGPLGLTTDDTGAVLMTDLNSRVRRFNPNTSVVTTFATSLSNPCAIAPDGLGGYLVTDTALHQVRRFTSGGSLIGNVRCALFVAEDMPCCRLSFAIYALHVMMTYLQVAGNTTRAFAGDGGAATRAALNSPRSVIADPAGTGGFFVGDSGCANRIMNHC
jgi:hypothetical protein